MTYSRRTTIKTGALVLTGSLMSPYLGNSAFASSPDEWVAYEERHKMLIQQAIDAALSAGASYADARISFTQNLSPRSESLEFGVRALVEGYWGFSSGPVLNKEEAVRLGYSSAELAKANVLGQVRRVNLAPLDPVSGTWTMPIKDDPFEMDSAEIMDSLKGLLYFMRRLKNLSRPSASLRFVRQRKTFGSSLGQFTSQLLYRTSGLIDFTVADNNHSIAVSLDCLTPAGLGFEHFRERPLRTYIESAYDEAMRDLKLPIKPIEVGKYPVLINPIGVGSILSQSIGSATQIDRAMGYEANAGGTSYINDPVSMLNSMKVGNSLVTVLGSRSQEGSVGRVYWDDEGVNPTDFKLVDKGILANMQTSREGAAWLKENISGVQSTGVAYTPTAVDTPLIHSADLTLLPGKDNTLDIDGMREQVDEGIEFKQPVTTMDFQQITGYTRGMAYEIKKGKRVARLRAAGMIFRTPELWNNVVGLGGQSSSRMLGLGSLKGEPAQLSFHSVIVPPVLFNDMNVIDVMRKG